MQEGGGGWVESGTYGSVLSANHLQAQNKESSAVATGRSDFERAESSKTDVSKSSVSTIPVSPKETGAGYGKVKCSMSFDMGSYYR